MASNKYSRSLRHRRWGVEYCKSWTSVQAAELTSQVADGCYSLKCCYSDKTISTLLLHTAFKHLVYLYKFCAHIYYNRFMILCPGLPRWVGTRRINHSGFCWSRHDGVTVASAEPNASYLHFAPEDNQASTSSVRFLWAVCPSWCPTNSVKALKANCTHIY